MALEVFPATEADVPRLMEIQFAAFADYPLDHLVNNTGNNTPANRQAAGDRLLNHMRTTSYAHVCKCVETQGGVIVGSCIWDLYAKQRSEAEVAQDHDMLSMAWERDEEKRKRAYAITGMVMEGRRSAMGNRPHGVLMYMCVEPKHQRKGAGTLLVRWGLERCEELGIPAFLEASEDGVPMYDKLGYLAVATPKAVIEGNLVEYKEMLWMPRRWGEERREDELTMARKGSERYEVPLQVS